MKKKILLILCFITLACLSVFSFGCIPNNEPPNNELRNNDVYNYNLSGKIVSLTDYGKTLTEFIIPDSIDGVTITAIGKFVFNSRTTVTSVIIPDSVTSIDNNAFSVCSALSYIKLPKNLRVIHDYTFLGCGSLTTIELPENLKAVGSYAFFSCRNLSNVIFNDGLKAIRSDAFSYCPKLTNVTIPRSVTTLWCGFYKEEDTQVVVNYLGTKSEWELIDKRNNYTDTDKHKIICLDGEVEL